MSGDLPCRHPAACVVSSAAGTHYCSACEEVAALRGLLKDSGAMLQVAKRELLEVDGPRERIAFDLCVEIVKVWQRIDAALAPPKEKP